MAKASTGWRRELRDILTAAVGMGPLPLGAVYDDLRERIPLHDATRIWLSRDKRGLSSPDRMRLAAIVRAIREYDVVFDPRPNHVTPATRATMIMPTPAACQHCGTAFLRRARQPFQFCSSACGKARQRESAALLPDLAAKYGIAQAMAAD